jgi:hypothetical protein
MTRRSGRLAILFGAALVVAACASGGTATDGGGGGTTPTQAPAATDGSVATAPPTEDAGSGGGSGGGSAVGDFSGKICDLLTLDEVTAVSRAEAAITEEQPFTAGSGFCTYKDANGSLIASISLVGGATTDANVVFGAYKADPSSVAVPVNGGEAIWFDSNRVAIVLKNGYTGSIQVLSAANDDMQTAATSLLQALADRMP